MYILSRKQIEANKIHSKSSSSLQGSQVAARPAHPAKPRTHTHLNQSQRPQFPSMRQTHIFAMPTAISTSKRPSRLLRLSTLPLLDGPPSPLPSARRPSPTLPVEMLSSSRSAASMALRGTSRTLPRRLRNFPLPGTSHQLQHQYTTRTPIYTKTKKLTLPENTVKPTTALIPFRAAAVLPITHRRDASSLTPHGAGSSLAKPRKEVLLPSEEGTKGVVQYALYALPSPPTPTPFLI